MAQHLHITFKAGLCEAEDRNESGEPRHVKPLPTPGYIYLFTEDELLHFCWRPRSAPASEPKLDLIMFGGDGNFNAYRKPGLKYQAAHDGEEASAPPTNGRIYVLNFSSSSDRHFFWLQSKPQGDPSEHSARDLKLSETVNRLLYGEEFNAHREMVEWAAHNDDRPDGDGDTAMEDGDAGPGDGRPRGMSGGAGAGATGGDIREEGEGAREGGADGGRADTMASNPDAQAAINNFLQSLQGGKLGTGSQGGDSKPFASLSELLAPSTTISTLSSASEEQIDSLLSLLPPTIVMLASGDAIDDSADAQNPDEETLEAVKMSLSAEQKQDVLVKVLRSPQFAQSLSSLTSALAEGGLPTLSEALGVPADNGGYIRGGTVALGGGEAVTTFVEGMRKKVEDEEKGEGSGGGDERMDVE